RNGWIVRYATRSLGRDQPQARHSHPLPRRLLTCDLQTCDLRPSDLRPSDLTSIQIHGAAADAAVGRERDLPPAPRLDPRPDAPLGRVLDPARGAVAAVGLVEEEPLLHLTAAAEAGAVPRGRLGHRRAGSAEARERGGGEHDAVGLQPREVDAAGGTRRWRPRGGLLPRRDRHAGDLA